MHLGQPIASGNTADIYLVEGKILKLFHNRFSASQAEIECSKQKIAYACGLPVPQIYDLCSIQNRPAILMEYIPGISLGGLIQQNPAQLETYLAHTVDLQRKIHEKTVAGLVSMKEKFSEQLQKAVSLDAPIKAKLLEKLERLPMENRLCHGDFHAFNLIQAREKTVIVDWVDASAGSPYADVYRSYLLYTQFSSDMADCYLRLYCEKSGFCADAVFAWAPIVAGARLAENVAGAHMEHLLEIIRQSL